VSILEFDHTLGHVRIGRLGGQNADKPLTAQDFLPKFEKKALRDSVLRKAFSQVEDRGLEPLTS
jgi:hypothetical protein